MTDTIAPPVAQTSLPVPSALPAPEPLVQRRLLQTQIPGPRSVELQRRREAEVSGGFGVTLPVFVEQASGAIVLDVDGNQLIDLASGIAVTSVGASAPEVVAAVAEQAARFTHTCFMVTEYDGFVDVAAALNRLTPGDHEKRTALFTTGAEAVENAIKIARTATGREAVVVLDHAYHGRTLLTMTMTAKHVPYKAGFGPYAPEVYRAPMAYPFRAPGGPERATEDALARLEEIVLTQIGADRVAAIVAEPIQGEGGFIVPSPGFLPGVAEFARRHGIVFIADEIQTGFGRTGRMFASEHEGIVPDLITTAKALAGGMPLSAVTGRAELMNAVPPGSIGGTYAGNPVACAAALAAIEIIERDDLAGRARDIEHQVLPRLQALAAQTGIIGDVRGRGAMLAMELVKPGTTEPDAAAAKAIAAHCHAEGVITLVCGTFSNVIRLLPPLVIEPELLADALDVIEQAVREHAVQSAEAGA
ncbi:4-aminobutyrate aminotransferase [Intrasporangium oryzae NRRL B-24470]|uniref:(S)-3-amino-2-methylpropionate transaminase n=1 Tax=Intrasporangium oryzae NRRL B-24470 TaxID=1386089 RepID=W9G8P9_9MICO|nr:4-aminobutyrate--2-oxoglutarate transaminase [Intrasporangium oryzae]EWT00249.1 4-aminobutyrate aminotransferase [Intrasporangium oryzae NRRL B-24470]